MLLNKTNNWIWLLVLFTSVSCDKELDMVKYPEYKQKLVISSFISPGDTVSYISVSSNQRIFGELNIKETTGNLIAFLSDGTREIKPDTLKTGFKFFPENMQIEEGKTYTLRVLSDKGFSPESSCKVPFKRKIEIDVDTFNTVIINPGNPPYKSTMANIFINDYMGEDNYYRVLGEQYTYIEKFTYSPLINWLDDLGEKVFSDKGRDGKRFLINTIHITDPELSDSSFLKLYILFTDKAYYDYHQSLSNYSGDGNPFTEVSPLFSNINGGLGIFSAYTSDTVIIRLK